MLQQQEDAGAVISRVLTEIPTSPATPDDVFREHVLSAMGRGLPEVKPARSHGRVMSIAAGGPSLADTWCDLTGTVVAVNGSLSYLLKRGVKPWACGAFDPNERVVDLIEPHPDVLFFLGSTCHPRLFDKLKGCKVGLWHPLGMVGIEDIAKGAKHFIGGGSTMGLRWFNLGYFMGFRDMHGHGLDSSYRGGKTHAYPDYRDDQGAMVVCGYRTSLNFMQQVQDWFSLKEMFSALDDRPKLTLHGDGLLQHVDRC